MKAPNGISEINQVYGNPSLNGKLNPAWYDANMVTYTLPAEWQMVLAWNTKVKVKSFPVHKKVLESFTNVMNEIWAYARIRAKDRFGYDKDSKFYDAKTMDELRKAGMHLFGGSFNFRFKRSGKSLSLHSWGCAVDFDPANNALGDNTPAMPMWVVNIFEKHGWTWGGTFRGNNIDAMHFQYASGY